MMRLILGAGFGIVVGRLVGHVPRLFATPHYVRVAGRTEMRDPPHHWDTLDETLDQSFPASDPPANY